MEIDIGQITDHRCQRADADQQSQQPEGSLLSPWQALLFTTLSQWSSRATDFFRIPANRVVELGAQVRL